MFANFLRPARRRAQPDYERAFVESVRIPDRAPAGRRTERLLLLCWIVIGFKCALVSWAIPHYHVPFSPLWVILPTLAFAGTVTVVYLWRD